MRSSVVSTAASGYWIWQLYLHWSARTFSFDKNVCKQIVWNVNFVWYTSRYPIRLFIGKTHIKAALDIRAKKEMRFDSLVFTIIFLGCSVRIPEFFMIHFSVRRWTVGKNRGTAVFQATEYPSFDTARFSWSKLVNAKTLFRRNKAWIS